MRNLKFMLPFCTLLVAAFACGKKTTDAKTASSDAKPTPSENTMTPKGQTTTTTVLTQNKTDDILSIPVGVAPNLLMKIQRTPCFGKCAAFEIQLFNDGRATYRSIAFAPRTGSFEAKATAEMMQQIQDKALTINYLKMESQYPSGDIRIADLPTTTTYVRVGSVGRSVINKYDAPKDLIAFEQWLVQQLDGLDWQKTGD